MRGKMCLNRMWPAESYKNVGSSPQLAHCDAQSWGKLQDTERKYTNKLQLTGSSKLHFSKLI